MTGPAVAEALRQAWSGADPGPTDHRRRPPEASVPADPRPLPRRPDGGTGGLLDLALAADPTRRSGGVRLRRVPSAGGRYPVDALVDGRVYDPLAHALDGSGPAVGERILLRLDPVRTVWRYGPRSLPVLLLDLGHASAAVLAAASCLGRPARARSHPDHDGPAVTIETGPAAVGDQGVLAGESIAPFPPAARLGAAARVGPAEAPSGGHGPKRAPADCPADGPVDGTALGTIRRALAELRSAGPVLLGPAPVHAEATLLARRTAGWDAVTAPGPAPDTVAVLAAAHARLDVGQDAVVLCRARHAGLLGALAGRACGQPDVGAAAALLLVTADRDAGRDADRDADQGVLARHLRAGAAVHDAWLAATAAGIAARPVGCWIDAVLRGADRRARVTHALALGPAPAVGLG